MKLTSHVSRLIATLLIISSLTACDSSVSKTIPSVNEETISDAAVTLGVSVDTLESFFDNIGITYDDYIASLNQNNQTLSNLKEQIETTYDCTFDEYIETIITVNNKTIPDETKFHKFESKYSIYDAYIALDELNEDKTQLINYDAEIAIADENDNAYAFDALAYSNGEFRYYMNEINRIFGCKSVEVTNLSLFGGKGVTKPEKDNACMDKIFVYDDKTNEILEKMTLSVVTLKKDDENENITLALSNELGLIFKTTGSDSYEKMKKISNLDIQTRPLQTTETVDN